MDTFQTRIGIRKRWIIVERGKPEYPERNLSEQWREPKTNSTQIWRRVHESNPRHNDGRWALSQLRQGRRLRYKVNVQPDWCMKGVAEIFVLTTSENTSWWNSLTTELLCVAFWSSFTTEYCWVSSPQIMPALRHRVVLLQAWYNFQAVKTL